jgi:hypothetical protein
MLGFSIPPRPIYSTHGLDQQGRHVVSEDCGVLSGPVPVPFFVNATEFFENPPKNPEMKRSHTRLGKNGSFHVYQKKMEGIADVLDRSLEWIGQLINIIITILEASRSLSILIFRLRPSSGKMAGQRPRNKEYATAPEARPPTKIRFFPVEEKKRI